MKLLSSILNQILEQGIDSITDDSRSLQPGGVFIAIKGESHHGLDFMEQVQKRKPAMVLSDKPFEKSSDFDFPLFHIPQLKQQLIEIYQSIYQIDLAQLMLIAVTGTNGKTSVAHLISQALHAGYVGTLGMGSLDKLEITQNTTPRLQILLPLFKSYLLQNVHQWVLEMSSHALMQQRLQGMIFKTAVFMNLSHDHLDYHQTMQAYAEAKYKLFLEYQLQNAVICTDDEWGRQLLARLPSQISALSFASQQMHEADIYPLSLSLTDRGISGCIQTPVGELEFSSKLIGHFNVSNIMAVVGCLLFEGWHLADIRQVVSNFRGIDGRMEVIRQQPTFIVDYAHTPDALEKALTTLRTITSGKLWCIVGCGGDRDPSKRSVMGAVAEKIADQVIITNDNPRTEDPLHIAKAILSGIGNSKKVEVILDREKAIHYAFTNTKSSDLILVAGKGHEDYQIIGDKNFTFSDKKVIQSL